jgi:hypothetical protein
MRAHLRAIADGDGHVLMFHGERALELSTLVRRAALAWATGDREAVRCGGALEAIELRICELEELAEPKDRDADEHEHLLSQRDRAATTFRAAAYIRDSYEDAWRKTARDLLEEMCPQEEDEGVVPIETTDGEVLS